MASLSSLREEVGLMNRISFPHLIAIVASVSAIGFLISRLALHPLRHIPGPFLASLFAAPLFYQAVRGNRASWILQQHKRYGPVIRIAPNKVCVSSDEGVKLIYSNKASKSHAYDTFKFRDVKMCIGLLDVKQAHARRKALLPAFSRQNLLEMEPVIRRHLEKFLDWLEKFDASDTPVETFQWFRYLTFDVVTDIAFGQQIGMLTTEDSHFTEQVEFRNKRNGLNGPFPFVLPVMRFLRMKTAELWDNADDEIAGYAIRARNMWAGAGELNRHRVDILSRIEQAGKDNPDSALSDTEVIAEMMEILNAGSDTTANTAMFTSYELARHPEIQAKLHRELATAFPDPNKPLDIETLEKLPFLDGVVREGLRIHAPIPSFLERIAPEAGLQICGYAIPKRTIVGMQAYTNHRDPNVFPEPEQFVPERWFELTAAMKLNFLPFSAGPRACVGLNLANMQLRIHLGHIFRKYRVTPGPGTTSESMGHVEFFTIRPKGMKCYLHFHKYKSE